MVKENDWPNPDQPQTFDKDFLNKYSALFAKFGWSIPESCECSRAMLAKASDYSNYCRDCVAMPSPAGGDESYFSACTKADWCEANCPEEEEECREDCLEGCENTLVNICLPHCYGYDVCIKRCLLNKANCDDSCQSLPPCE